LPTKHIHLSTSIEVDHIKYKVDFIKHKFYKRRKCIMHSINSWKDTAHLQALSLLMQGKKPYYSFNRKEPSVNNPCGWIVCQRCKRACCSPCANMIVTKVRSENNVTAAIVQNDLWLWMISEFLNITPPSGCVPVIYIPTTISHCC
jgi:hypothetical protein